MKLPCIAIIVLIVMALVSPVAAIDYHVSPSGDDAASGLSPDTALRTLARAADLMRGGDRVLFERGGVYNTFKPPRNITGTIEVIPYGSVHNAMPIIRGISGSVNRTHAGHFIFRDLNIQAERAGAATGVQWRSQGEGVIFRGCIVENWAMGLIVEARNENRIEDFIFEGGVIRNIWHPSSHSHGIYADGIRRTLRIHRTHLDRCGAIDASGNEGTIFNHALYITTRNVPIDFQHNVLSRCYADGGQFRTGGIVKHNVFAYNPIGVDIAAQFVVVVDELLSE